jgi:hypothetical protein
MASRLRFLIVLPALGAALYALPVRSESVSDLFRMPDVCEITGLVASRHDVARSALPDGAPSLLAEPETDLAVVIGERMPHGKIADAATCHSDSAKGKKVTYKLCSPTPVQTGDMIHGTEGAAAMNAQGVGCLFDVAILPKG